MGRCSPRSYSVFERWGNKFDIYSTRKAARSIQPSQGGRAVVYSSSWIRLGDQHVQESKDVWSNDPACFTISQGSIERDSPSLGAAVGKWKPFISGMSMCMCAWVLKQGPICLGTNHEYLYCSIGLMFFFLETLTYRQNLIFWKRRNGRAQFKCTCLAIYGTTPFESLKLLVV